MSPSVHSGPSSMPATESTSPPSGGACYDPIDVDAFLNYDQLRSFSPSQSPMSAPVIPSTATANPNNTLLRRPDPTTSSGQKPSFAAPSHRYDLHKQQTGIPLGAVAHTSAVLENSSFNNSYRDQSLFDLPVDDGFFDPQAADDLMNLTLTPGASNHASFGAPSEMDLELNPASPDHLPAFFFPDRATTSTSEFVDPSVLGKGEPSRPPPSHTSTMPRLWPGVHQQQAAMAKARQQQQQQQLEDDKEDGGRQSRPAASTSSLRHLSASTAFYEEDDAASRRLDSIAEEKIPQLLNSMRQASVAGSDGSGTPQPEQMRDHVGRSRKDEDDMDEDERLLASEEGKKLSSKERRQLRNKVSARAFRSRRKEYIGQLEGEAAIRNKEVNDLKQENRALRDENTRLSDLTRMLLSSPAFSTFLDQLGASGSSSAAAPAANSVKPEAAPAATMSDAPAPADRERSVEPRSHQTTHVGMTLMPDAPLDTSVLDIAGNDAWAFGALANPIWGNNRPQVFSVHDLPQGPAVDRMESTALLSEKPLDPIGALASFDHAKDELAPLPPTMPTMPTMPTSVDEVSTSTSNEAPIVRESCSVDFDESDPAFALFAGSDVAERVATPSHLADAADLAQVVGPRVGSKKEQSELTLTVPVTTDGDENGATAATMDRFHRLCSAAEVHYQRITRVTSHL